MITFGLFNQGDTVSLQVYEGDTMKTNPPYTILILYSDDGGSSRETASIRLDKGQSVKVIEHSA